MTSHGWTRTIVEVSSRAAKDRLFDAFAEVGKALSSGRRAEIVDVLDQAERSVEEVAGEIGQSVANTSAHLRALARAGLVAPRRSGNRIIYRLASDDVAELWTAVRAVAATHVAGLDHLAGAYLGDRQRLEEVSREELARGMQAAGPEVVVLDVRPKKEYEQGHIPGAQSVPPSDLEARLRRVRRGTQAVAYCRGPYCVFADDAVRALRRRGVRARRLQDGFPEWRRAGFPVAVGAEETGSTGPSTEDATDRAGEEG